MILIRYGSAGGTFADASVSGVVRVFGRPEERGGHRGGGVARGSGRGGLDRLFEGVHFVVVAVSQFGELGGERADHAAGVVGGDALRWGGWCQELGASHGWWRSTAWRDDRGWAELSEASHTLGSWLAGRTEVRW
ncbi:MAG: hypothetical protein LC776_01660 [Acidobacteria bacterium]|nr:hypothetical protein [Acidobacteriota bacterium]